jgi:hypothetical protein
MNILTSLSYFQTQRADPVPEAPTRVGSGEGNNRSKVLPPQKFYRETASNPRPGDSASYHSPTAPSLPFIFSNSTQKNLFVVKV